MTKYEQQLNGLAELLVTPERFAPKIGQLALFSIYNDLPETHMLYGAVKYPRS